MADSVVNQILALMMQQGEIESKRIKEEAAWKQEIKRAKNAWKGNTLKALATIGIVAANAIPGVGPYVSAAGGAALAAAGKKKQPYNPMTWPDQDPNAFVGPLQSGMQSGADWSSQAQKDPYNPWDDEPI